MESVSPLRIALTALLAVCVLSSAAFAQGKKKTPKTKPELYAVVQVDDAPRVIKASGLKALKAELDRDYKRAIKEHADAQKAAKKSKTKFDTPKPKKAKLKVLKANCKSEEEANKVLAAAQEKGQKKGDARSGDKGGKADKGDKKK